MAGMTRKVELKGAQFYAYHGFYEEEQLTGTVFMVDIAVTSKIASSGNDELATTVNYEELYDIAARHMAVPRKLLETVAELIIDEVQRSYPDATGISVAVHKVHPPLRGQVGSAAVTLNYIKHDEHF